MSNTPRTDVQEHKDGNKALSIVDADFARQLERELNAAKAALSGRTVSCSNCNAMAEENAAMREAIKDAQSAISAFLGFHSDHLTNAQIASLSETLQKLHHQTK